MRGDVEGNGRVALAVFRRRRPSTVGVYWTFARAGFKRQAQYKLAMFAGLFTNCVFGFVRAAVLVAAVRAAGDFGGYTEGTIGAYVWLSQALLGATQFMGPPLDLVDRIKSGDVAIDFLRPVDIQLSYLATDMGRAACTFLPRGVPSIIIGAATFGLSMPATPVAYLLGLASVLLAVALSFLCLFAVALIGFWVVEIRGIRVLYQIVGTFLAGLFVPVHMFPDWLRVVAMTTPFPSILQAPIDTLSGRAAGTQALTTVAVQCFWVLVIGLLGRVLLRAGQRRLEVQGG
ncbi:ABC transporter permease [Nocardia neocaledoniensis NBRC 108232]|uniref:ABC-2 type transport system permease protein n=1 Tax=Nocardia neocaledoniensis TaxID=236511 RepID=A0A317NGH4_9NOCA|nr:ABC-2 family transporter protein [Nocardia neocaledoniensis]PWV72768.1 ABC-2 type transport system permease protein [Nocardia neocaledoniensis]GEM33568.1 ABC transporter permease [Nocardia neocaledoniensis NBRC 108232]